MSVSPAVLTAALRAQALDASVRLRMDDGSTRGPDRIAERLIRQEHINGCTVSVRLTNGETVHLGHVTAVLRETR